MSECPFCGHPHWAVIAWYHQYCGQCRKCLAKGPIGETPEQARENWEARAVTPEVRITDGVLVCIECGTTFVQVDDDPTCHCCREVEG